MEDDDEIPEGKDPEIVETPRSDGVSALWFVGYPAVG